jgi:hypothetical protein
MRAVLLFAVAAVCAPMLSSDPAHAQATRTWVSGVGDDANPCSRTAPCKTFAGAISKTATAGIISCLDPAGFGALTIVKSISIECKHTQGSVLAPGTNGINVNGANIIVHLRGLVIEGTASGTIGVNFINGSQLHISDSKIYGFTTGSAMGIKFAPPAGVTATLTLTDTIISDNGTTATNGGLIVQPLTTGSAHVSLTRVQLLSNSTGVRADGTGVTGFVRVSMRDSTVASNGTGLLALSAAGVTRITASNSTVAHNTTGVSADGSQAGVILAGGVAITANNTGITAVNSGTTFSYTNTPNFINGNITTDGTPTNGTLAPR